MATILFDSKGDKVRVEDATRVAAMLENGFTVTLEPVVETVVAELTAPVVEKRSWNKRNK